LDWFERAENEIVQTQIVSALNDPRARKIAAGPLVASFEQMPASIVKDRTANTLATLARDDEFDEIAALIRDPKHGRHRAYLFWAVAYMKHPDAVELALEMLDDDEVGMSALRTLADLTSERAEPVLRAIAGEPKPRGRSDEAQSARDRISIAEGGLQKLYRARARGTSRP
jgi:hypothetical protein